MQQTAWQDHRLQAKQQQLLNDFLFLVRFCRISLHGKDKELSHSAFSAAIPVTRGRDSFLIPMSGLSLVFGGVSPLNKRLFPFSLSVSAAEFRYLLTVKQEIDSGWSHTHTHREEEWCKWLLPHTRWSVVSLAHSLANTSERTTFRQIPFVPLLLLRLDCSPSWLCLPFFTAVQEFLCRSPSSRDGDCCCGHCRRSLRVT